MHYYISSVFPVSSQYLQEMNPRTTDVAVEAQEMPSPEPVTKTIPQKTKQICIDLDKNSVKEIPSSRRQENVQNFINQAVDLICGAKHSKKIIEWKLSKNLITQQEYQQYQQQYDNFMPVNVTNFALQDFIGEAVDTVLKGLDDHDKNNKIILEKFTCILFNKFQDTYSPRRIKASEIFTEEEIANLAKARDTRPLLFNALSEYYEDYNKHDINECVNEYLKSKKWKDCRLTRYSIGNSEQDYTNLMLNIIQLITNIKNGSLSF